MKDKEELGKGKGVQREVVGGVAHLHLLFTSPLAGMPSVYTPYPGRYKILSPLQCKSIECLPLIRLCTRYSHIFSCSAFVEPQGHRIS